MSNLTGSLCPGTELTASLSPSVDLSMSNRHNKLTNALFFAVFLLLALQLAPAHAAPGDVDYDVAVKHYNRHWWEKAVDAFDAFRKAHPQHPRHSTAVFFQGEALIQLGEHKRAGRTFAEFIAIEPQHAYTAQARLRIGEMLYFQEQPAEALAAFEDFLKHHPAHELCKYALPYAGELALAAKRPADAQRYYQDALKRFPTGPMVDQCRFGLAKAFHDQNNRADALRFYGLLASDGTSTLADNSQFQIGLSHHKAGEYSKAIDTLKTFQSKFASSELRYDAAYWLAQSLIKLKQWKLAESELAALAPPQDHTLAPAFASALGLAFEKQGEAAKADKQHQIVIEKWPGTGWAADSLKHRVMSSYAARNYEQTIQLAAAFQRDFAANEHATLVHRVWGRSLLQLEKYAEAIPHFRQITKNAAGKEPAAQRVSDQYYLARALSGAGRHKETLEILDQIQPADVSPELAAGILATRTSALMGSEQYPQAVTLLETFLAANKDNAAASDAQLQLALAATHTGELPKADAALKLVDKTHPLRLPAMLFLAETAYSKKQNTVARDWFTALLATDAPAEYATKARSGLAWLNADSGNHQKSAELFNQVLTTDTTGAAAAEAAMMRGQALEKSRKPAEALAMYRRVLEQHAGSTFHPQAMLAAARLYDDLNEDAAADKLLERFLREHPKAPQVADALYRRAWVLIDLSRDTDSAAMFKRLVDEFPDSKYAADSRYRLAEQAVRLRQEKQAIQHIDALLKIEGLAPALASHALYMKGQLAAGSSRWEDVEQPMQAIVDSQAAENIKLPARYWLAESLYRRNKFDAAVTQFDQLSRDIAGQSGSWIAMVPLRRAQLLMRKEKWEQALAVAETISAQHPGFRQQYEADYVIGRCLASQANFNFDKARAAYRRVIDSPNGGGTETAAMAQWMIGETYFMQKKYDLAIRAYERVEVQFAFPKWQAGALLQAGKCHELKGLWNVAAKLYAQVLKDYPGTPFREEAVKRLTAAQQRAARTPGDNATR